MLMIAPLHRFLKDARGISAIEFAFMAPVALILLLVGVDTTRYARETRRLETVAQTIGQMLSVNQTGSVNYVDLQFFHDSAMVTFPEVLADAAQQGIPWSSDLGITMSDFQFTPPSNCPTCALTAKLLWTGGTNPRSCKAMPTAAADTASPSPSTLPTDAFVAGNLLVIDLTFNFRPTIAPKLMPTLSMARSFYVSPRYVPTISYSVITGDNGIAKSC